MADPDDADVIRSLRQLVRLYPAWALPAVVTLGLLSYAMEGIGIGLFIPLLQTLQNSPSMSTDDGLFGTVSRLLERFSAEDKLLVIGGFIFASILIKNVITYGNAVLHALLNARITHALRVAVVDQLLALSQGYLEGHQSGQLMNTLSTETWRTAAALSSFISLIVSSCAIVVFSALLILISWRMTLVVTGFMVMIYVLTRLATAGVKRFGREAVIANTGLSTRMWEIFSGMKVIRAFGREAHERNRYDAASQRVRDTFFRMDALSALTAPLHEVLSVLLVLGVLIESVLTDRSSLPALVAFAMVLLRLQPQVRNLASAWVGLTGAASAVRDVMWLLDPSDKTYIRSGRIAVAEPEHAITFEDVSFSYPGGDRPALDRVSLRIPSGRTTALVGPSGAGKSTIVNLVCRFYDADRGEVRVDDRPLRDLDLPLWRRAIGIVSQDIYVFGASVRENIAYGVPDATEERIVEAARLADAHAFIAALPQGYDTRTGDGGISLTGGQRQRIALARAVIGNPRILILDEATNSLDSLSEHLITEALDRFGGGRTVIVIAHRLSTIERADNIVVLDEGRVAEEGDLRTLVARKGLFSRMYRLQNTAAASE